MKIEERDFFTPVEVRDAGEDESPTITGTAAVFYREGDASTEYRLWDGAVERIMPGAFDAAIATDDVRGLFNHDPNMLLGRSAAGTLDLAISDRGLEYDIAAADTGVSRDVLEHIRRGDVTGSSFAFVVEDQTWRTEERDEGGKLEIREINQVSLFDVGPVTYPAYEGTKAGTRDTTQAREARDAFFREDENEDEDATPLPGVDIETYKCRVLAILADCE